MIGELSEGGGRKREGSMKWKKNGKIPDTQDASMITIHSCERKGSGRKVTQRRAWQFNFNGNLPRANLLNTVVKTEQRRWGADSNSDSKRECRSRDKGTLFLTKT